MTAMGARMSFTWVQDRTGLNVIHITGCSHVRMDHEVSELEATELGAALIEVAVDNCDPEITTAEEAAVWVAVAPCVRRKRKL